MDRELEKCLIHNILNRGAPFGATYSDKLKTQALEKKQDKTSGNHHLGKKTEYQQQPTNHIWLMGEEECLDHPWAEN